VKQVLQYVFSNWLQYPLRLALLNCSDIKVVKGLSKELLDNEFDFSPLEILRGAFSINGKWDSKLCASDFFARKDIKVELSHLLTTGSLTNTLTPMLYKFFYIILDL